MMPVLIMVFVLVAVLFAAFYGSRLMVKRAARQVIELFRANGATEPGSAVTAGALGLARQSMADRMFKVRDFRPDALTILGHVNVVKMTGEGKLYLSEDELNHPTVRRLVGGE